MSDKNRYERGLERVSANHAALTPCDFMARAAAIYPARTAVVHGALRRSYGETYARCRRLAGALAGRGIGIGDTVSIIAPNVPAMLEAHFGVPMAGAVLNALNVRLDPASIAGMLAHARSRVLIADAALAGVVEKALAGLDRRPHVVAVGDDEAEEGGAKGTGERLRRRGLRGAARGRRAGFRLALARRRVAGDLAQLQPRAPPAGRRGSSITTAAPT